MATATDRMPVIYLSHGAPPLADDPIWPGQLAGWSAQLPQPTAVLMISAHWEAAPITLGATETVPLVYDFGGFAEHYYRVTYPAPGAPELAEKVAGLLGGPNRPVRQAPRRGLDHGAYVPLAEMYPDADIPVLQLSMPTLAPAELTEIGRRLAPLRDEGVLIVGSGFFTHNLQAIRHDDQRLARALAEFDDWGSHALDTQDLDSLLDFEHAAPAARLAHPRTEHFAPLFVTLGAGLDDLDTQRTVIDGTWLGLSKRSIQIG